MSGVLGVALVALVLAGCELLTDGLEAPSDPGEFWSATPLPPDAGLAEAAPRLCGAAFGAGSGLRISVQAQHSSHRAAFILTSVEGIIHCIVSRGPGGDPIAEGGTSFGGTMLGGFEDEQDLFLSGESAGPPASRAYGRASGVIQGVRVQTTNSGAVDASMGDGWFLAMWPGVGEVLSVDGLNGAGEVIATVPGFDEGP